MHNQSRHAIFAAIAAGPFVIALLQLVSVLFYQCVMVPTLVEKSIFSVYLFVNFFVNNYCDW